MASKICGTVETERFVLPYRVYGTSGPTLVCLSGAQQTMAIWRRLVSYFRRDYQPVVLDLPGQGRAQIKWGPKSVTLDEQVRIVRAVVQATAPHESLILLGASWGGIIAAAYAAHHPGEVDKMLLGSFGTRVNGAMMDLIRDGRRLWETGDQEAIGRLIVQGFGHGLSATYQRRIIRQFAQMDPSHLHAFEAHVSFVENARSIHDFIDLKAIRADTLIVNGREDPILDSTEIDEVSSAIPLCQTHVVDDVGHFLHFEEPKVLEIYERFLES